MRIFNGVIWCLVAFVFAGCALFPGGGDVGGPGGGANEGASGDSKVKAMFTEPDSYGMKEGKEGRPRVVVLTADGGERAYDVEIADTFEERRKGLMFRESMGESAGMFFVFEVADIKGFWMKNTLIPLDMIFIDEDYKVLNVAKNVQPCKKDPCESYRSVGPAKYVLEVNAGEADKWAIGPGAVVTLNY